MKTCKKCGAPLEENVTFCGKCGEKDSAETSIENVPKKHGYFWNIVHYSTLEKSMKRKTTIKTIIGALIFCLSFILIPLLIVTISNLISSVKPYSYVNANEFFENWNATAENNPNGITKGVKIDKSEGFIHITDTVELYIDIEGRDIRKIEYHDDGYGEQAETDKERIVTEFLSICIPKVEKEDFDKRTTEFIELNSDKAPSGLKGFSVNFEEVANEHSIRYEIQSKYDYSSNIVKSNLPTDCAFNVTLEEFKSNCNKQISEKFSDDTIDYWPVDNFKYVKSEYVSDIEIEQYSCDWTMMGKTYAIMFVFIDTETGNIIGLEYNTNAKESSYNNDTAFNNYTIILPACLFSSLNIPKDKVYSSYLQKALNDSEHQYYNQGVLSTAGVLTDDSTLAYTMMARKENVSDDVLNSFSDTNNAASNNGESSVSETDGVFTIPDTITSLFGKTLSEILGDVISQPSGSDGGSNIFTSRDYPGLYLYFPIYDEQYLSAVSGGIDKLIPGKEQYTYNELKNIIGNVVSAEYSNYEGAYSISAKINEYSISFGVFDSPEDAIITSFKIVSNDKKEYTHTESIKEKDISENSNYIGKWTGDGVTLEIISADGGCMRFNLMQESTGEFPRVAYIGNASGQIEGSTVYFSFDDDSWGNSGTGTLTLSDSVIHAETSLSSSDGEWAINVNSDLYR